MLLFRYYEHSDEVRQAISVFNGVAGELTEEIRQAAEEYRTQRREANNFFLFGQEAALLVQNPLNMCVGFGFPCFSGR